MTMEECIRYACENDASDLHLTVGLPPMIRKNGRLLPVHETALTPPAMEDWVRYLLNPQQAAYLDETGEIDTSFSIEGLCRFRLNAYRQRGCYAAALRVVGDRIRSVEELGVPAASKEFAFKSRGLVLVTGPTGSGKSTTLAALIDLINRERDCHIITIEDPIEYIHRHKKSMINQREVGQDTGSYANALRAALREDPDVILIGEMRDLDSISIALTAAETGHLVFSTLHTIGAAKTIDRIIDVFPPAQQQQIRVQFSMILQGVVSQQLLPTLDGRGRVVATEIMITTPAISNMIREAKTPQINNAILTGGGAGMITMDNSLLNLYHNGRISRETLFLYGVDAAYLHQNIRM